VRVPQWISTPRTAAAIALIERGDEGDNGVEGNSRLTAATGMVLLVVLAV